METQRHLVAGAVGGQFESRREVLLDAIKSDRQVEAVEDFSFDRATNTIWLDMASISDVSEDAKTDLAYDMASALAPLAWSPAIAEQVSDLAALSTFQIDVDDLRFSCSGPAMAALADKELSQESFVATCAP